jgi:hypothetical protein
VVENEQDQPPAAGVSRHRKILRDFKSDLIRIGTGTAVTPGRGNGSSVSDRSGISRWSEGAFRLDKGVNQIVEALTRKPKLHIADIFSAAANNYVFLVVREARSFHLRDPYCHLLAPQAINLVDHN